MSPQELAELDLAVARADGVAVYESNNASADGVLYPCNRREENGDVYQPTRDRAEAMRLLEKYRLTLYYCDYEAEPWECGVGMNAYDGLELTPEVRGPTPTIAICRAVVALKGKA